MRIKGPVSARHGPGLRILYDVHRKYAVIPFAVLGHSYRPLAATLIVILMLVTCTRYPMPAIYSPT